MHTLRLAVATELFGLPIRQAILAAADAGAQAVQFNARDELRLVGVHREPAVGTNDVGVEFDESHGGRRPRAILPGCTLFAQQSVAEVVDPLAADGHRPTRHALVREAEQVEHTHRGDVQRIERGLDAMHGCVLEQRIDHRLGRLEREPPTLVRRGEGVTEGDLRATVDQVADADVEIADHRAIVFDGHLHRLAHRGAGEVRLASNGLGGLVGGVGERPVLVAGDVGVAAVRGERVGVVEADHAEHESLGVQRQGDHSAIVPYRTGVLRLSCRG